MIPSRDLSLSTIHSRPQTQMICLIFPRLELWHMTWCTMELRLEEEACESTNVRSKRRCWKQLGIRLIRKHKILDIYLKLLILALHLMEVFPMGLIGWLCFWLAKALSEMLFHFQRKLQHNVHLQKHHQELIQSSFKNFPIPLRGLLTSGEV